MKSILIWWRRSKMCKFSSRRVINQTSWSWVIKSFTSSTRTKNLIARMELPSNLPLISKKSSQRSGWARPHLRVGHSCHTGPSIKAPWQILPHIWPDVQSQVVALNRCILGYPRRVCKGSYKADHQLCTGSCRSSGEGKMAMDGGGLSNICREQNRT